MVCDSEGTRGYTGEENLPVFLGPVPPAPGSSFPERRLLGCPLPSLSGDGQESPSFRSACALCIFQFFHTNATKCLIFVLQWLCWISVVGLTVDEHFLPLLVLVIINSAAVSNTVCIALAIFYLSLLKTWTGDMCYCGTLLIFSHWFIRALYILRKLVLFMAWCCIYSIWPLNFYFV